MSEHRRNTHYRKIVITAAVVAAVGMPSAAMACVGWQDGNDSDGHGHRGSGHWKNASHHRWGKEQPTSTPASTPDSPSTPLDTVTASATSAGARGQVAELVNAERSKAGCAPLTVNSKLTKAAQAHSKDMADNRNMSHTGSDGTSPSDRIKSAGYNANAYGENVADGYTSPESVMDGWMSSPGHKRNILDCDFKEIGVGLAQPGNYWTQDFAAAG